MEALAYELNVESARLAREVADEITAQEPERPRFVGGSIGPTNRTASISPDVVDASKRNVTFDELEEAYHEETRGLLDGGCDFIIIETIFDTLNAKAAIFAVKRLFKERGITTMPLMISGTLVDQSGRTLSGQTTEAFYVSVRHAEPFCVGLNCALGAKQMRPFLQRLSKVAECFVSVYSNAGLPNAMGGYDDTPEDMARDNSVFIDEGLINMIGGCCGSTPEHIKAIAGAAEGVAPRPPRQRRPEMWLSGLEDLVVSKDRFQFLNVGERCNIAGSPLFKKLILAGDYAKAMDVAKKQVEDGAMVIDVNMDEGLLDGLAAMQKFLKIAMTEVGGWVGDLRQERARAGLLGRRCFHPTLPLSLTAIYTHIRIQQPTAGGVEGAHHGGLLQVRDHRGGPQVGAGQVHRQLHLAEGMSAAPEIIFASARLSVRSHMC